MNAQEQRERTALAVLRSGGSFQEAAETAHMKVEEVMKLWKERRVERVTG